MKTPTLLFTLLLAAACIANSAADQCVACQKTFNFISNVTHNGDDNLKTKLAELCSEYSYLPGKQATIWCTKAINGFFSVMNKHLNTDSVCYDIKACTDARDNGIRELRKLDKKEDCDFCLYVTNNVKNILTGGPTEVEVKSLIEDGCHYLSSFEAECKDLVNQYADEIFQFINQTFQPVQFCKSLNICAIKTGPLKPINSLPSVNDLVNIVPVNMTLETETDQAPALTDINCDICKKIVKIIQAQLKDNATDQQIINVLTEVCQLFPSKERSNCQTVVTDYTTRLIQVLTQDIDSNLACTLVGLCVPQSFWNYINKQYVKPTPPVANKNVVCVECQLVTHFIQNELYNYKNEEQIEEFIMHHFCSKIAMFVNESSCNNFVQEYGPIIMQTIAQEIFDPTTFCYKEIHVCSQTKVVNIGFNKPDKRCQMCQDIVGNLQQVGSHDLELEHLTEKACSHLPKAHSVECGLMMKAFAPYFFDMLNHNDNAKDICKSIDICMVPGSVHLLGGHKCTYGPSLVPHRSSCRCLQCLNLLPAEGVEGNHQLISLELESSPLCGEQITNLTPDCI